MMATLKSSKIAAKVQADGIITSAIKRIVLEVSGLQALSVKSNPKSPLTRDHMAQA